MASAHLGAHPKPRGGALSFKTPPKSLRKAQLEIFLGIRRHSSNIFRCVSVLRGPSHKALASLKAPLRLKDIKIFDKWQLDQAMTLELDPKMEGSNLVWPPQLLKEAA